MKSDPSKPAGIKEIAASLGISIGTVDRALHGRPGISEKTRARVLRAAGSLGYQPNLAARQLKLNRKLRIGVYLPLEIRSFFDPLRRGIRAAAGAVHGLHLELCFHDYPRLGDSDLKALGAAERGHYQAIILSPGSPESVGPVLRRLAAADIAAFCVATDAPLSERITSVAIDAEASGGLAAQLLGLALPAPARVAVITGNLQTEDHTQKLRGFAATCAILAPQLSLLPAIETHDQPQEAYEAVVTLLRRSSRPGGLYISTANSLPVLEAIRHLRLSGKIQVVTTDLYPELLAHIESGTVLASLYQRPFTQGKTVFESLVRFMVQGERPQVLTRLAPHVILRSNLAGFASLLKTMDEDPY